MTDDSVQSLIEEWALETVALMAGDGVVGLEAIVATLGEPALAEALAGLRGQLDESVGAPGRSEPDNDALQGFLERGGKPAAGRSLLDVRSGREGKD
jgi:hypothetical protein